MNATRMIAALAAAGALSVALAGSARADKERAEQWLRERGFAKNQDGSWQPVGSVDVKQTTFERLPPEVQARIQVRRHARSQELRRRRELRTRARWIEKYGAPPDPTTDSPGKQTSLATSDLDRSASAPADDRAAAASAAADAALTPQQLLAQRRQLRAAETQRRRALRQMALERQRQAAAAPPPAAAAQPLVPFWPFFVPHR